MSIILLNQLVLSYRIILLKHHVLWISFLLPGISTECNDFLACFAVLEHQINPLFTPSFCPFPSISFSFLLCPFPSGRNDKLFTGRILRVEATPGNARQERIGATRREAVFKKFKRLICQSRYISFASRNLDIVQSVISHRDLSLSFCLSFSHGPSE